MRPPPSVAVPACRAARPARRPLVVWLAGAIGLDAWGSMGERLAWDVSEPDGRPPTLVVCELERSITVGRLGSRFDVDLSDEELARVRLPLRFAGRGGGAILHYPGQVHVALFATLADLGLEDRDAGGLVERMESGLEGAVRRLRCGAARDSGCHGVFGRGGLFAAVGMAVRRGVASHGAWLNVTPPPPEGRRVRTACGATRAAGSMGSVEAEVRRRVRLQDARSALVEHLVDAYAFPACHVQSGFPLPVPAGGSSRQVIRSVG